MSWGSLAGMGGRGDPAAGGVAARQSRRGNQCLQPLLTMPPFQAGAQRGRAHRGGQEGAQEELGHHAAQRVGPRGGHAAAARGLHTRRWGWGAGLGGDGLVAVAVACHVACTAAAGVAVQLGWGAETSILSALPLWAGVPACSTPVLKSLAGKAGKARKKLAELGLEEKAEGEARELLVLPRSGMGSDSAQPGQPIPSCPGKHRPSIPPPAADLSMLRGIGEDSGIPGEEMEGAIDEGLEDDDPIWETDDTKIQAGQALKQVRDQHSAAECRSGWIAVGCVVWLPHIRQEAFFARALTCAACLAAWVQLASSPSALPPLLCMRHRESILPAACCHVMQEAVKPRNKDEMEAIAAKEGYGRLFSTFGTVEEVRTGLLSALPVLPGVRPVQVAVPPSRRWHQRLCMCPVTCSRFLPHAHVAATSALTPPHLSLQGLRACDAVDSLVDASAIDTLLSNFIVPLQSDDISKPDANGGCGVVRLVVRPRAGGQEQQQVGT